jgi:hypothetical protein
MVLSAAALAAMENLSPHLHVFLLFRHLRFSRLFRHLRHLRFSRLFRRRRQDLPLRKEKYLF